MKLQVIKNSVFKWLRRILIYGAYTLVIFFLLSFILLQLPSTQKSLIQRYTSKFSKISGFDITYDRIFIIWWDRLEISGLTIKDPAQNNMIKIESLEANFKLSSLLQDKNVNIDGVSIEGGSVNLVKIPVNDTVRDLNINLFINEINKMLPQGSGQGGSKVNIGEIVIHKTYFSLNDSEKELMSDVFDYNHIRLSIDEVEAQNFKVIGDTIEFNINSLLAIEENAKLPVHNLSTFFRISQRAMEFYNLQAKIGESFISDTLVLKYNALSELSDFNEKVSIQASLKNSVISPEDLSRFTGGKKVFDQALYLRGKISGKISRLLYQNMELGIGSTTLKGKLELDGLPSLNETFINFNIKEGQVLISDLKFLFPENVYDRLKPLGRFSLSGKFTGFIDDFVADGNFLGSFGQIKSDINLKLDKNHVDRSSFEGNLALNNFDLGLLLSDTTTFQHVTMTGKIRGKGLSQETADFNLTGKINSIGIRKYNYQNIVTDARFSKELFSGKLTIHDPNLQLTADGSINIRKGEEVVKVKANLDTLHVDRLGFSKQPLFIHTQADIDTKGLNLDSLFGNIILQNTFIKYKDESLQLDSIYIRSALLENQRNLLLRSSYADVDLVGDFYYSTLFNDLPRLFKEFQLNVRNDKRELAEYYARKKDDEQEYFAAFTIKLNNINPLLKLSQVKATVSLNTVIEGKFSNGVTSSLQAFSEID
ncbi:MAG: hypothetical protein RI909_1082, partial [Bacteroidota bacterium]